jgi:hypothetical protein
MPVTKDKPEAIKSKSVTKKSIEEAFDELANLHRQYARTAPFWTPEGLQRLSRLIIRSVEGDRDQQTLAAQAMVCPSTIGNLRKNFGNSATGRIGRNIEPRLALDLAPFVPSAESPSNGWYLVFMGCGFLDGRDPSELFEGVEILKQEIEKQTARRAARAERRAEKPD